MFNRNSGCVFVQDGKEQLEKFYGERVKEYNNPNNESRTIMDDLHKHVTYLHIVIAIVLKLCVCVCVCVCVAVAGKWQMSFVG